MNYINVKPNNTQKSIRKIWRLTTAGRAYEGLRADWQRQLRVAQEEIGFEYIRFHGLLCDEMVVLLGDEKGNLRYNFTYIDELFDFLLSINLRPFVEFGFMPTVLAKGDKTIFWWKGNISMPKDMDIWNELIRKLMTHWIERYGVEEVLKWYFEVWNEPNLQDYFFDGDINDYIELYKNTVDVIKSINKDFKVGGPATSNFKNGEAPWVKDFIKICSDNDYPLDFISTHPYPNNFPLDGYGSHLECYRHSASLEEDLTWLNKTIDESKFTDLQIHLTEWNNSPNPRDLVHDTAFMAPFIIKNNLDNMELTDTLGYWAISDIFEEKSPGEDMFHGGFGLINKLGIKKPAYWAYWFLSKLGDTIVDKRDDFIVTKTDNSYQILAYNYSHYGDDFAKGDRSKLQYRDRYDIFTKGINKDFCFNIEGLEDKKYTVKKYTLDRKTGSAYDKWLECGAPEYPTKDELEVLKRLSQPSIQMMINDKNGDGEIQFQLKEHGVVFVDIKIKD